MSDLWAFVLAGGKSTRMGADKAFLELDGRTLLERALDIAHSVTGDVRIVGARERYSAYAPTIEDVFPERGPLGGIHAALSATNAELNLMLGVDLPFVRTEFLRYMADRARTATALVTVPRAGGRLHPLCAVYRRAFGAFAAEALRAGCNKIDPLFAAGETLVLEEAELGRLSFFAAMFDNLNTREDFARALAALER